MVRLAIGLVKSRHKAIKRLIASLFFVALCQMASAQDSTLLNPNLIETDAPKPQLSRDLDGPGFSVEQPNFAPENADEVIFEFKSLSLNGSKAIEVDRLYALWPFTIGQRVTVADIFRLADDITNFYRSEGYALSFALVPAQQIEAGTVEIEIIEGWLDNLNIQTKWLPASITAHIERTFRQLAANRPTKIAALERYLLMINDMPGISARGVISPGEADGASSLTLIVEDTPFTGSFGYNDYLSDALENELFSIGLKANNIITGRDSLKIDASRSPESEVFQNLSTGYETYLDDDGLQLMLSASESSTKPKNGTLASSGFQSNAHTQTAELRKVWLRSRSQNLYLGGTLSRANSTSKNAGTITSEDKTLTVSGYADYDTVLPNNRKLALKFMVESGLEAFNAKGNSRQFARVDYQLAGIDGQMTGRIALPFNNVTLNSLEADLSFKFRQMISDHPVLAGAECSFGGPSYGSAFESGALSGENCALASFKLRWNDVLTGTDMLANGILQYFARLDAGYVSQQGQLTAGEERNQDAASWGVGATLIFKNGLSLAVERSLQLKNSVEPTNEGKGRTNIRMNYTY